MRDKLAPRDRRVANRLTTIVLALQMLDRKTELSTDQPGLVTVALEAADALTTELLQQQVERTEPTPDTLPTEPGDLAATRDKRLRQ